VRDHRRHLLQSSGWRERALPEEYRGDYFFADLCNGWIRKLDTDGESVSGFASGARSPVDLNVGPDGVLYYLELGSVYVRVIRPNSDANSDA
jgi:glucose/arabinose dehydrogenase